MQYVLFLIFLLVGLRAEGKQTEDYYFRQISIEDGLSQSTVRCTTKDYKGFIWIGTENGLNYYDHSKLITFHNVPEDSTSIPGNRIYCIKDDRRHNVWVGTNKGLACFDRIFKHFHRIHHNGRAVYAADVIEQPDGNLLFCGRNTLYIYNVHNNTFDELPIKNNSALEPEFTKIVQWDADRILLLCSEGMLWLYEPSARHIRLAPFYQGHDVNAIYVDGEGDLWLSPFGRGVIHFDSNGEQIAHYTTRNSGLNNNLVLSMIEVGDDRKLWIGTNGGGVNILNVAEGKFDYITTMPGDEYALPTNSISNLYVDSLDNVWAGTPHDGLVGIKHTFVKTFTESALGSTVGMSSKATLSFCEGDKYIWIGTDGGINRFDPRTEEFKQYPTTASYVVTGIETFTPDELLIAVSGKGVGLFNKNTGLAVPFTKADAAFTGTERDLRDNISIAHVKPELYLFMGDSICLYNRLTDQIASIQTPIMPKNGSPSNLRYITTIDSLVFLHDQRRIYAVDLTARTLVPYYRLPGEHGTINCVVRDDYRFWLGTSVGLYTYNIRTKDCRLERSYRVMEITALANDGEGHIWIGANGMIFSYDPRTKIFTHLDESDGVTVNDFLPQASLCTSDGNILMGGTRGFTRIKRKNQLPLPVDANIELTDVVVDGTSVIDKLDSVEPVVTLPHDYSSLSVKMLANKEYLFRKKIYRYYVEGFTKTSPIVSYDNTLKLHNLSPGTYKVIAASNIGSSWSSPRTLLRVVVTPPWYESSWFIFFVFIAVVGGFVGYHRWLVYRKNQLVSKMMVDHDREVQEDRVLFLTNINHELRTPLTLIHAPIKQMLDHSTLPADVRRQLTRIYKHTKQMRNTINMVLDLRKMESVDSVLTLSTQSINQWLRTVIDDYSYEFAEKDITLRASLDPAVGEIPFDQKRMETVLTNILINAFKFSEPGTTVTVNSELEDGYVRVSVTDEGIGLKEEDIEHLFSCFFQGRNHAMPGSGLGLPYAKKLVELHHGIIGAYNNEVGRGATFFFKLPLKQPEGQAVDKTAIRFSETYDDTTTVSLSPEDFSAMAGRSILIVEDETDMRNFLVELLAPKFATVYKATNGADALILIKQHVPDIVISDIMMSRLNGLQLCQQVKSDPDLSHIPFVLLTAKTDSDSIMTGYKAGADAYLEKPFDPDYLLARLSALLRNKTSMREHYKNYNGGSSRPADEPVAQRSNSDEQFIIRLNNIIETQLDNCDLDVKFITETLGIGRASLYAKMKTLLGVGVNDYINRYRIGRAAELLVTTDHTIQEIASMCGFSNQRYFSTVFKQAKGVAPTHYREQYASKPDDAA